MNQAEPEGGQRCAKTGGKAFGLPYHELLEFMGRFSYNFARHPEEQRYNESLPPIVEKAEDDDTGTKGAARARGAGGQEGNMVWCDVVWCGLGVM